MYDLIVIGGGHAGAEAAWFASRAGLRVALLTLSKESIGRMSCNPAIGGLAKGHLVREIDAMGGLMSLAADAAGIQFKTLNRSKGPAVQGPRAQCDRTLYAAFVRTTLERLENLALFDARVSRILVRRDRVEGVALDGGQTLHAPAIIVTTGTFLRGLMHTGETRTEGGRYGEPRSEGLSDSLRTLGLRLGRLKTGTPPRIEASSVDFTLLAPDHGDPDPRPFSIESKTPPINQALCWITHTNEQTHQVIVSNLHRSPMFSGQIEGTGPRYCPSIEDKVVRFRDKTSHHVFVEPEGLHEPWLYLNGISTSLPADVQDTVVRSLPGFGNAAIARYGYAVEYDFVNPNQLAPTLEVHGIRGLFLAGQINGTSGYEEAAAQGMIAGINAVLQHHDRDPLILSRDLAYTGVLVDDLITLGTEEPYRMLTSRAEYRLLLGCDTVYQRLSPLAMSLGILSGRRAGLIRDRLEREAAGSRAVAETSFRPDQETSAWLESLELPISSETTLSALLQRRNASLDRLIESARSTGRLEELRKALEPLSREELDGVVNQARYSGYIERQKKDAERVRRDHDLPISEPFEFNRPGLSAEVVEKLNAFRPRTLGQAARIPGVTPAAVSILRMHLARNEQSRAASQV
ncbi:MAG: tRNA uridine-5-carboxymethylaminomethyl(34) synthesis enzyme MnmG [Acidobacteria bacterium]|nr:tRNA uridine-5-carboxymethylaminomethyl(34) synthesis enzyme MnmG [Acidobacteriota bacterium]